MSYDRNFDPEGAVKPSSIEVDEFQKDLHAKRVIVLQSDLQMRVEYDSSGNAIYVGTGAKGLASFSNGWLINKYTYDSSNNPTQKQSAVDSWDDRASASYT